MGFYNSFFYPAVIALIRNDLDVKFYLFIKGFFINHAVAINKIGCTGNLKAVFSEQPLINFNLPLVTVLPFSVEINLPAFGSGFIIDNKQFSGLIHPNIINSAIND